MAPKITEEKASARREQIIMAAVSCFAEKGFHKTTMQDICKAARLSPGAVYHYFESKDDIIKYICEISDQANDNLFEFADAQEYASPKAAYKSALSLFINQYKQPMQQTGLRMDAMFLAEALHNSDLAEIGIGSYGKIINRIKQMVDDSQQTGDLNKELSSTAVAQVMFSLVQGMGSQIIMSGDETLDIDAYLKAVLAIITGDLFNDNKTD